MRPQNRRPAVRVQAGRRCHLQALARFHYVPSPPGVLADVVVARYRDPLRGWQLAGVATLSYPALASRPRSRALGLDPADPAGVARFLNRQVRTVSRVIVHPRFRGLGLATRLVRALVRRSTARYVEALARMGRVFPLFEQAGFTRTNADRPHECPHYLLDRAAAEPLTRPSSRRFR